MGANAPIVALDYALTTYSGTHLSFLLGMQNQSDIMGIGSSLQ